MDLLYDSAMSKSSSMDTLDQILEDPGEFIGDYLLDRSKLKVKEKIFKGKTACTINKQKNPI